MNDTLAYTCINLIIGLLRADGFTDREIAVYLLHTAKTIFDARRQHN